MSEMLPQLPEGWAWCALQDIAEVRLGRQRSPKNHAGENMVPYLRAANVKWTGLDLSDVKEMNFTPEEVETYALHEGDILLAEASGSASEVGKPVIWRDELDVCCFQNTLIRVRSEHARPEYLLLVLRQAALSGQFAQAAAGVGIHHLGASRLSKWPTPLPPLAEQDRIVAVAAQLTDEVREGVADVEVARSLARAYLKSKLRQIDEYDAEPLSDLADIRSGITKGRRLKDPTTEVPYLRAGNLGNGVLNLSEMKTIPATEAEVQRFRLEPGDVLLVEGSGSAARLGQGWLWEGQLDVCLHQNHAFRARPDTAKVLPRYLAWALQAPGVRQHLLGLAKTTSGLNTISRKQVAAVPIPLPDLLVQAALVAEMDQVALEMNSLETDLVASASEAAALERSVLLAAVRGAVTDQIQSDATAASLIAEVEASRAGREPVRRGRKKRDETGAGAYS